ncbi:MAG TPA: cysteine desulfurase NifS, partial [Lachnospiraceae bacterium]|nr:cysteine desulfurase NifS [Lachnospiraceae bacterium]
MIYADNAATTRMSEAAIRVMTSLAEECWGNPSSLYVHGQKAKEVLEKAREEVAAIIGAEPREIIFTSGGSEADNQAIRSAAELGRKEGKRHIISTAFEHHAVLHTLGALEKEGFEVTLLDVHENG